MKLALKRGVVVWLCGALFTPCVWAEDAAALRELKETTVNLIRLLVQEGVLSEAKANELIQKAEKSAASEQAESVNPNTIRVPYIPESVRDQIRDQVRIELKEDVSRDVMSQAREERWGVPGANPSWVDKIKVKGDIRLRGQADVFANLNPPAEAGLYADYTAINKDKTVDASDYLNTSHDRARMRARLRLGIDAKVATNLDAKMRLATGSSSDPVSTNQTVGVYGSKYQLSVDQAYLKYNYFNDDNYPRATFYGGRMANPWVSTDLVWDSDLAFDGVAGTIRLNLAGGGSLLDMDERNRTLFLSAGIFPLQEFEFQKEDKWLFGVQFGGSFIFEDQSELTLALAYYDFENIVGVANANGSSLNDYTKPGFLQKGNTLYDISDATNVNSKLYGLASDYNLVNFTLVWNFAKFAPYQVLTTFDYVKNIGFDQNEVTSRVAGRQLGYAQTIRDRTDGYMVKVDFGWPIISKARDWNVTVAYKYLESDAVLDAFTDSDFHLGGTDAKGWILGGQYGLTDETWLQLRLLSANEIDGANETNVQTGTPLGIDVIQLDLNAKF